MHKYHITAVLYFLLALACGPVLAQTAAEPAISKPTSEINSVKNEQPAAKPQQGPLTEGMSAYERGDYPKAWHHWRQHARQGHPQAQLLIGTMLKQGIGTDKDEQQAAVWFRKAAKQGNIEAQFNLGAQYARGQGLPKNQAEAAKWYLKAANRGHAEAQNNIGVMLANGLGVLEDPILAIEWYQRAASQGHPSALFNLAYMYMEGLGVEADSIFALRYYRLAAKAGSKSAQRLLADAYKKGWFGLPIDPRMAQHWHRMANNKGLSAED